MTQGFPAQPQFGQPQQPQYAPQGYAPPVQPQFQQPSAPPQGFFTQQDPHLQTAQGPIVPPPQPAAPVAPQPTDTSGFFGGGAAISWDDRKGYVKGTPRGGKVIDKKITNQTKMGTNEVIPWPDGSPRKQMELTLQTAERADPQDDGQRRLFIKGDLPRATREAMKPYGKHDIEIGAWFYAAWVDEKPSKQAGYNPQKIFNAVYAPPGAPDPMAGQPAYAAQPVPQQAAYVPAHEQVAPSVIGGVPQPHATPEQFAAYAAQQNAPQAPQQPVAAANDQQAQFAAWQAQQAAQGQQPPTQPGAQPNAFAPQQVAPPAPQAPSVAPAQWNPFTG